MKKEYSAVLERRMSCPNDLEPKRATTPSGEGREMRAERYSAYFSPPPLRLLSLTIFKNVIFEK